MISLKPNERLVLAGVLGKRSEDGEIIENVPLYEIQTMEPEAPPTALMSGEASACEEAVHFMAAEFGKYVRRCERAAAMA